MAKGHAKAPTKAAPKKAPPAQRNKNKGAWKRAADDEYSAESSDEELDQPRKNKHAKVASGGGDNEEGEVEVGEAEPEVEKDSGHESSSDPEVRKSQSAAMNRVNILQGWRASRSAPHSHPLWGLQQQGKG